MSVQVSEAPSVGLGKLIKENSFVVPSHQRDYRWKEDRVRQLFDDFQGAIERGDQFYFIGLMVFMEQGGSLRVLDGQQRLATTIILLSAIRARFAGEIGDSESASQVGSFIGFKEIGESEMTPRLRLNLKNDDIFQSYVVDGAPLQHIRRAQSEEHRNGANRPLLNAIVASHQWIDEVIANYQNSQQAREFLVTLVKFIRDSVIAVRLTVPNESNAFRVFETLNDRSLELSAVDLIKNYLFGLAHDQSQQALRQIESRWEQLTTELQETKEEEFLKVYYTSRFGRYQLDNIFHDIKERVKTSEDARNFSIDMLSAAEKYVALDNPGDAIWSEHSPKAKERLKDLAFLGGKQIRPVILSALDRFSKKEFERLLELLEVVLMRWQIIGGQRTGALEIACSRVAERIWNGEVKSALEARKGLDGVYLSDDLFRARFVEPRNLQTSKAFFVLSRIERFEREKRQHGHGSELEPSKSLTIEHVLPKAPDKEWEPVTSEDPTLVEDWALSIGNLCLLTQKRNKAADRQSFEEKKKVYAGTDLLVTKKVAEHSEWKRENIVEHQDWLASRAVKIWKFDA